MTERKEFELPEWTESKPEWDIERLKRDIKVTVKIDGKEMDWTVLRYNKNKKICMNKPKTIF